MKKILLFLVMTMMILSLFGCTPNANIMIRDDISPAGPMADGGFYYYFTTDSAMHLVSEKIDENCIYVGVRLSDNGKPRKINGRCPFIDANTNDKDLFKEVSKIIVDDEIILQNCSYLFAHFEKIEVIENANLLNVSNVANMQGMFQECKSLPTIDVSNWDVSKVTDMSYMFYECNSLNTLDVSKWNVSNVTDMKYMFACQDYNFSHSKPLRTLDVSKWNVSKVTDMSHMFYNCQSLRTLDVSNWDVSKVKDMSRMFCLCRLLKTLDVSRWNVTNLKFTVETFNGCGCESIPSWYKE